MPFDLKFPQNRLFLFCCRKILFGADLDGFQFSSQNVVHDEFFVWVVGYFFAVREDKFACIFNRGKNDGFLHFCGVEESATEDEGLPSCVRVYEEAYKFLFSEVKAHGRLLLALFVFYVDVVFWHGHYWSAFIEGLFAHKSFALSKIVISNKPQQNTSEEKLSDAKKLHLHRCRRKR
jgi:hypothetical protein